MNTIAGRPAHVTAEDVEFLLSHDPYMTARQIADRLGYRNQDGVYAALRRTGRRDLLDTLSRNTRLAA